MARLWWVPVFLYACGPSVAPFDLPAALMALPPDVSDAERSCLSQECVAADSAMALEQCRLERCVARPDRWTLVPTTIRHEGETVFVQARLGHEPGGFGPVAATRTTEAYVGVTVVTSTGTEIDLAVTTVFPDGLEVPFTLSADVGPDVRDVLFGVWDRKVQPCDSERMGCKQFGFLLDGSLATWPPGLYTDGVRQRIPSAPFQIMALDAGAGKAFPARRDAAVARVSELLAVFGVPIGQVQSRLAADAGPDLVVYRDDHDGMLARQAGEGAPIRHDVAAEAALVISFTGDGFAAAKAACGSQVDAAYDACLAGLP